MIRKLVAVDASVIILLTAPPRADAARSPLLIRPVLTRARELRHAEGSLRLESIYDVTTPTNARNRHNGQCEARCRG